ncbi:MAG: hypothetical protein ABSF59_21885 [Candidatus Sulfotelmatobacter sp.]|jgi:hypothetical protein
MTRGWPWVALALLGAYHGLNPAMGWLFALALGLQEKRRSAVIGALLPIALGHAAAITVAILVLRFVQTFLPLNILQWGVAGILFTLGVYRLFRASHPRGAGMRVGGRDLFVWSFLMASAHGAGLMLLPVLMAQPMSGMTHSMAGAMPRMPSPLSAPLSASGIVLAVLIHTASMLAVAGILALAFFESYEKVGLRLLRHTWLNFDLLWAVALMTAGIVVLFS